MANVRRGNNGEITHILVNGRFYKKEDASKIMYGSITEEELLEYARITNQAIQNIALRVMNEHETIYGVKAAILVQLGKIEEPE